MGQILTIVMQIVAMAILATLAELLISSGNVKRTAVIAIGLAYLAAVTEKIVGIILSLGV